MREAAFEMRPRAATPALLPLHVRGLTLEQDGRTLLDGIDLTLEPGHLTVVMGPNGAGKSLLLRLLHGLVAPTRGSVRWGGHPLDETVRRRQAMVFQTPVLLRRSVAANIDFVLRTRGLRDPARRDTALAQVGLTDKARQSARLLSGGEKQRLALARALVTGPEVLLLDEPAASLDPASTQAIERIVRTAHEAGIHVVLVTHDTGQARRLADEVVFLHAGRVVEHAPAESFFAGPSAPAARAYLDGRLLVADP